MKDFGIRPRTIEAARRFAREAPAHPIAADAREAVKLADLHGGFAREVADACDKLYQGILALDTDGDGEIEAHESPAHESAQELLAALRANDVDGDGSLTDEGPSLSEPEHEKPRAPAEEPAPFGFSIGRPALVITLWSSRGARWAWEQSRKDLAFIQPDGVLIHTDPLALARGGADLTRDIRATGLRVGWAWYGDSYGPDPSRVWAQCGRAAERVRPETAMPNCEAAWKLSVRGTLEEREAIARRSMQALRAAAPSVHISFTSYDGPVSVPWRGARWGGHAIPWRGFEGDATLCNADALQVYLKGSDDGTGARLEHAVDRDARAELSRNTAIKRGLIDPSVERWMYLQAHGSRPAATCYLGTRARVTFAWASPTRIDQRGVLGLAALSRILRAGFMSVQAFQRSVGLPADGVVGPRTLAALGLVT